ncbi:hypothetical protein TNCV_4281271 [Trichonephila clavipes]|nr:hypothetical protein TNCV_4281271 [Trichonephila clavipes]
MPENDEDVNVAVQTPKISHSEGLKAAETALQYFEQGMSVILRRLCDKQLNIECNKVEQHDTGGDKKINQTSDSDTQIQ